MNDRKDRHETQEHLARERMWGSLRGRLITGFLMVALLPFLGITFILIVSGAQSGHDTSIKQLNTVLNYKRSAILIWKDALKAELGNVLLSESTGTVSTPDLQRLLQAGEPMAAENTSLRNNIRGRLHLLLNESQYYDEFMILDLDGNVLVASNLAREGQNYATEDREIGIARSGLSLAFYQGLSDAYLSPPVFNEASQRSEIFTSYPIVFQGSRAIGVMIGRAYITILNNILREESGLSAGGKTYLAAVVPSPAAAIGSESDTPVVYLQILAGLSREDQGNIFESQALVNLIAEDDSEKPSGSYTGPDLYGDTVLGYYLFIPSLQVYLIGEQLQAEINRETYSVLAINASVAISSIMVALFIALQITRSIATPLSELSDIATTAAQGAEETRIKDLAGSEAFGGITERLKLFTYEGGEQGPTVDSLQVEKSPTEVTYANEISNLAQAFSSMTEALTELVEGLEERVKARTVELEQRSSYLQASAEVSRATASVLDPEELIQKAVNVIGDTFNLYYVGLFLVDNSGQWAVLKAGTGEAGQKMLLRQHRLPVGQASMIGWSISNAKSRIAQIAEFDIVRQANPDLPETRSEAAIPLRSRGRVIGALTVQSSQINAFDETILTVLQSMADQLAIAIDNANLFSAAQDALQIERRVYSAQTQSAWQTWLKDISHTSQADSIGVCYRANPEGATRSKLIWYPEMEAAVTTGKYAIEASVNRMERGPRLGIPITVRGASIGALSLARAAGEDTTWSDEEISFLEGIAEQLGIALDSARLYTETQLKAEQERMVSELTGRMRASLDVESVVKTAADEIFKAFNLPGLPLDSVVIELAPQHERESKDV